MARCVNEDGNMLVSEREPQRQNEPDVPFSAADGFTLKLRAARAWKDKASP